MSDNVIQLVPPPKPNRSIIALLKDALKQARAGRLLSVALVAETKEGGVVMVHLGGQGSWPLLGGMEHLKDLILREVRGKTHG